MKVNMKSFVLQLIAKSFLSLHFFLVGQMNPDFLHYTDDQFCMLDRFSVDKAADVRVFYPGDDDDPVHTATDLTFSLSDDDEDKESLQVFIPLSDKIVFSSTII